MPAMSAKNVFVLSDKVPLSKKVKGKGNVAFPDDPFVGTVFEGTNPYYTGTEQEIPTTARGFRDALNSFMNSSVPDDPFVGTSFEGSLNPNYIPPSEPIHYSSEELKNDPVLKNAGSVITDNLQSHVMDPLSKVADVVKAIGNGETSLKDIFESSMDTVTGTFKDLFSDLFNSSNSARQALANGLGGLSSAISDSSVAAVQSNNDLMKLIQDTTAANNAWSADQARLNREWQQWMSSTAHQREVADLKAAGLNPVLSAGAGSGAPVGSGSVAQPDTSNTRVLAEVALQAIDAASLSAAGLASVAKTNTNNSIFGKIINSNIFKRASGSAASALGNAAAKALIKLF